MAVEEKLSLEGVVEESLPNLMFRVELDNGHSVLAHMAGRMRRARIRVNSSTASSKRPPDQRVERPVRQHAGHHGPDTGVAPD
jgi:hypothetical protein